MFYFKIFSIVLYMMFVVLCGNSVLCGTLRFFAVISDTRLLQEVHRACYVKLGGATVLTVSFPCIFS